MSIRKQNFVRNFLMGLIWFGAGIFFIFDESKICNIIAAILAFMGIALLVYYVLVKDKESGDEMSEAFSGEAYKMGFQIMVCVMLVFDVLNRAMVRFNTSFGFSFSTLVFMAVGIGYISVGLYFAKLDGGLLDAKIED